MVDIDDHLKEVGKQAEQEAAFEELKEPQEEAPSTDRRSLLIMVSVLIGVVALFFTGSYFYNNLTGGTVINIDDLHRMNLAGELDEEEGYMYNSYSFVKADGLWWTEMNKFGTLLKVPLHFGPKEVEEIQVRGSVSQEFNDGDIVHIAIDPTAYDKYYTLAISELSLNVVQGLDRYPEGSCTEENYICENRSVISCKNNPQNKPVIELALANESSIELNGACVKLSGSGYGLIKSVDRLLYQWYGIMQ